MIDILKTTKYVVDNSIHVKINKYRISDFCKNFDHKNVKLGVRDINPVI